jgi:hypothetical protein
MRRMFLDESPKICCETNEIAGSRSPDRYLRITIMRSENLNEDLAELPFIQKVGMLLTSNLEKTRGTLYGRRRTTQV